MCHPRFLLPLLLSACALAQGAEVRAPGWVSHDVGNAMKPAIDIGPDGRYHVMGIIEAHSGDVWHAVASDISGPWNPQAVATGYYYGPGDIVVDDQGIAHLAWHDHDRPDAAHVMTSYDDNITTRVPLAVSGHDGWDNALYLDDEGLLHQSSVYPNSFGAQNSLQHGVFDGVEWDYEGSVPGSGAFMYGLATTLVVDSSGDVHVLFCRSDNWTAPGELVHATKSGSDWSFEDIVTEGIPGRFPSMDIAEDDTLHAAWLDVDPEDNTRATVRYGTLTSTGWAFETVDTLENVVLGGGGARKSTSLRVDSEGNPHVAFADSREVRYAVRIAEDTWETQTVLTETGSLYQGLVVMRLREDDTPVLVYWLRPPDADPLVRIAAFEGILPPTGWLAD